VSKPALILETERLILREITEDDAPFVLDLLNQPSFKKYIGDRGVRTIDEAREYTETRFINSYRTNGFGLYLVALKADSSPIGICGFVSRETLPAPDIGFALLPQYEKQGYALEAALATMEYGRDKLGFARVLAITTTDNDSSRRLLEKIGLKFESEIETGGEVLNLFAADN
jgi:[ribosomal protein S5]-alanine N-acetyltransferase